MTDDERTGWDLTEEQAREIAVKNLDRLYRRRTRFPISYILIMLYPWFLYLVSTSTTDGLIVSIQFCMISTLIAAVSVFIIVHWRKTYLKSIRHQLAEEEHPESLIPGDEHRLGIVLKYVPALLRWKFPSATPFLGIHEQAVLGAENLDWYLARPVRLMRFPWVSWLYILLIFSIHSMFLWNPDMWPGGYLPAGLFHSVDIYLISFSFFALNKDLADVARAIRIEVYRDFVLDWYKRHPLEDAGD